MKLPPYNIFPNISGDKVSLRQIQTTDIIDLVEISFYDSVQAKTIQQATEMQAKINMDYFAGNSIHWGVTDNVTNLIVGSCGYYRGLDKGEGELGCVLLPKYRGKGFMTSALLLAIDFGLKKIGLNRIWAITSQNNIQANNLLKRLDFKKIADLSDNTIEYELVRKMV